MMEQMGDAMDWRDQMMETHGWFVDAVFDTETQKCDSGTGCDTHTHGLSVSFAHMDLQCILPIDGKAIHSIFCTIIKQIKEGKIFEPGKCYCDLIGGNHKIRFMRAQESGRNVLRVILPDRNGKLHKSLMEEDFKVQYNGL